MVSADPFNHYCSSIQKVMEGGAKLTGRGKVTGHTSDMIGTWTIGAFDTKHANKKETPKMKEARLKRTAHSVDDHYSKDQQEVMKRFGFEWDESAGRSGEWTKYEKGGHFKYKTGTFKDHHGYKPSYTATVFFHNIDNTPVLFIEYYEGGERDEDEEVVYHFKDFNDLEQKLPQILSLKIEPMKEAVYANNAGIMEVFKFFNVATDEEKKQFDDLVNSGNQNAALKLVEKVLGIKFQGDIAK